MKLGTGSGGGQISVNMGLPPFSSQACSFSTDALGPELFPETERYRLVWSSAAVPNARTRCRFSVWSAA